MYVSAEERAFLDGLKVGDLVCVVRRWNEWRVSVVTKATASRLWIGATQYDRKTGKEWGASSSFYHDSLADLSPARIDAAHKELIDAKEKAKRNALHKAILGALGEASTETLEAVCARLGTVP